MEPSEEQPSKKPGKQRGRRKVIDERPGVFAGKRTQRSEEATEIMRETGRALPTGAISGEELVRAWGIPADEVRQVSVRVFRDVVGTRDVSLVWDCPIESFHLKEVVSRYGPDTYYIRGTGKFSHKSTRANIDSQLAEMWGYGRLPEIRPADVVAQRTIQQASHGPVDPVDLLAAVDQLMQKRFEEFRRTQEPQRAMMDPMDQLTMMQKSFLAFGNLEEQMLRTVEKRMGIKGPEPEDDRPWWVDLAKDLAPAVVGLLQSITAARRPVEHTQREAHPVPVPEPKNIQPLKPMEATVEQHKPDLTAYSEDEIKAHQAALAMLSKVAGIMLPLDKKMELNTVKEVSEELLGWLPPAMYGALVSLAHTVKAKGPELLEIAHPQLNSGRWPQILEALAFLIESEIPLDEG
jgi:hypothetical protein